MIFLYQIKAKFTQEIFMNFILNLLFNIQSTYSRGPQGVPLIGVLEMQINMRSVFKSWFLKIFGFKENCKTHTIYSSNANLNHCVNFCSDSISSQGQSTTTFSKARFIQASICFCLQRLLSCYSDKKTQVWKTRVRTCLNKVGFTK